MARMAPATATAPDRDVTIVPAPSAGLSRLNARERRSADRELALDEVRSLDIIDPLSRSPRNGQRARDATGWQWRERGTLAAMSHPQTSRLPAVSDRMLRVGTESAFEVAARARALQAQGHSIVHLEIGEPDFDTPVGAREAA